MTALAIVVVLAVPVAGLLVLLRLATVLEQRREKVVAQQVALTDAIHAALGPVVAPVVRRRRGGWIGVLAVPVGHPQIGLMVEIAQAQLGPAAEIVLVAQESTGVGGPEMAPHTPQRSPHPGEAVARLDNLTGVRTSFGSQW
jgi:hypothetical protein